MYTTNYKLTVCGVVLVGAAVVVVVVPGVLVFEVTEAVVVSGTAVVLFLLSSHNTTSNVNTNTRNSVVYVFAIVSVQLNHSKMNTKICFVDNRNQVFVLHDAYKEINILETAM